jgi:hypothetical protein
LTLAVDYVGLGKELAALFFLGGVVAFGSDWEPDDTERRAIEAAFADWARAKGMTRLSPDYALVACLGMYSLSRIQKPKVKSRLASIWEWIRVRLLRRKPRTQAGGFVDVKPDPHPENPGPEL